MLICVTQRALTVHQGRHQLLGVLEAGREVVIDEEEQLVAFLELAQLGHDGIDGAMPRGALEEGLHGAELARKLAAAAGLDEADGQIAPALEQPPVVTHAGQRRALGGAVAGLERAMARVVDDLGPDVLRLAEHHAFGIARHFVGRQRGVKAAHHHRHAALPVLAGDLVGALGGVGLDGNGHEIRRFVERNRLHAIVVKADVDVGRRQAHQHRDRQRLHLPGAHVAHARAAADGRVDERQSHRAIPARRSSGAATCGQSQL